MDVTQTAIAEAIGRAPAWALLALSMRSERMRDDGRRELARHVYRELHAGPEDRDQLALSL